MLATKSDLKEDHIDVSKLVKYLQQHGNDYNQIDSFRHEMVKRERE